MRFYDNAYLTGSRWVLGEEDYGPEHGERKPTHFIMHYVCMVDGLPQTCDVKLSRAVVESCKLETHLFEPGMLLWDDASRRCTYTPAFGRPLANQGQVDRELSLFSPISETTNVFLWRQWEKDEVSRGYESDFVIADDESVKCLVF